VPVAAPEITFTSQTDSVTAGDYASVSWSAVNADGCSASGAWSGDKAIQGSAQVGPLNASSTFSLSCTGAGGSSLQMLNISVVSGINLSWMRPTENVDGSLLTDLAAYRIYYGQQSRDYDNSILIDDPATTSYTFQAGSGEYFVGMTAIDADGNESGLSNEVVKLAP